MFSNRLKSLTNCERRDEKFIFNSTSRLSDVISRAGRREWGSAQAPPILIRSGKN